MHCYDYTPSTLRGKTHIVSLCLKKQNLQVKGAILVRVYRSLLLLLKKSWLRWLKTSENNFNGREKLRGELPFNSQPKKTFLIDLAIPGMYDFVKLYYN